MWNSSETLRNALTDAWNAIASSVGAAIQAVLGFLGDLFGRAQEILAPLAPMFQQVWSQIAIVDAAVNVIAPMVRQAFNTVVAVVKVAWEIIKSSY